MPPKQKSLNSAKLLDGGILYYPTIEIHDDAWLKSALCIWERVYRIVPVGYKPRDSIAVQKAVDAGLVESIRLSNDDLADCGKSFTTITQDLRKSWNVLFRPATRQG